MLLEELQLRPVADKSIEVCFKPEIELSGVDYRGGHLFKKTFKVFLNSTNSAQKK
jgi:hypothetical protein